MELRLRAKEKIFVENKIYLILNGSVCAHNIFQNGKYIPKEACLKKGEIVGNFFKIFKNLDFPDVEVEITAIENNTVIKELNPKLEVIKNDFEVSKIFLQILKENIFKTLYHLYDKKGYLLSVLKFYANDKKVLKSQVHYENFWISKSQFYKLYSELKKENFFEEYDTHICLKVDKIERYLKQQL